MQYTCCMVWSIAQDARLRMLFEKMSQFWEPSHSKRKKTKAEQKQEDEEETVASEDFAREPSEEPDEHARASMDAYMSALQHRSPQAAELDSLSHAAAGEDEEALAYALGTDSKQTCTPVECMKTGLSEDFQALALSKGARTMKDSVVIELGDSPVPAAPSMPSTRLPGLATSARDRLDRLRFLGLQGEVCMQACTHTHIHIHAYTCTHANTQTHTNIYTYIHLYKTL